MAAKLKWLGGRLTLNAFVLGGVEDTRKGPRYWAGGANPAQIISSPYDSIQDCMQDCESEVRRLLKEAGVEVAP